MNLTNKKLKELINEVIDEARMPATRGNLENWMGTLQSSEGPTTMAVITAQNPPAKVADPQDPNFKKSFAVVNPEVNDRTIPWNNDTKMKELEQDLSSLGVEYMQVRGEYFGPEISFLIFDISKEDAIKLGKKYLQDAIVFGQKMRATNMSTFQPGMQDQDYVGRDPESLMVNNPEGPKMYFDFELINLVSNHFSGEGYSDEPSAFHKYVVEDSRDMVISGPTTQGRTNLFTRAGGKKFVIPFFSDDPQHDPMTDLYNVRPVR